MHPATLFWIFSESFISCFQFQLFSVRFSLQPLLFHLSLAHRLYTRCHVYWCPMIDTNQFCHQSKAVGPTTLFQKASGRAVVLVWRRRPPPSTVPDLVEQRINRLSFWESVGTLHQLILSLKVLHWSRILSICVIFLGGRSIIFLRFSKTSRSKNS